MPRATRSVNKQASVSEKAKPYSNVSKATKPARKVETKLAKSEEPAKPARKGRDGKDSHLYTDDNPSTTLHGTGFKDAATAEHTIELVSRRSLLYQFQTINTMYHRAAHHPSSAKNENIQAAMKIFRAWLDETYPAARAAQRDYPLLKKDVVERYLPKISGSLGESETEWAKLYVALGKGKRLANVLMDETRPDERDLAVVRQTSLDKVIEDECGAEMPVKQDDSLWDDNLPSLVHLKLIAYGFSPIRAEELLKRLEE